MDGSQLSENSLLRWVIKYVIEDKSAQQPAEG
jgi:hypothetical protein